MILFALSNELTFLIVGLLGVVIVTLLIRSSRYLARQKRSNAELIVKTPRPRPEGAGPSPDTPPEVLRWEVEMEELGRALCARLDSKMSVLEHLIAEADRAAARLEAALGQAPEQPGPTGPPEESRAEPVRSRSAGQRRDEIYTLADYGLDAAEIAHRLGSPIGEVELILELRKP